MEPYTVMIWIIGSALVICQILMVGRIIWLACHGELTGREK